MSELVLALSTMLHGIGVGNMLPSWVKMVCVDINPAVVTKLADRGSSQTIGIVTDVGLFLHRLAQRLKADAPERARHSGSRVFVPGPVLSSWFGGPTNQREPVPTRTVLLLCGLLLRRT